MPKVTDLFNFDIESPLKPVVYGFMSSLSSYLKVKHVRTDSEPPTSGDINARGQRPIEEIKAVEPQAIKDYVLMLEAQVQTDGL